MQSLVSSYYLQNRKTTRQAHIEHTDRRGTDDTKYVETIPNFI
jgi:hypothetical protein